MNYQLATLDRKINDGNILERITHQRLTDEAQEALDRYEELKQNLNAINEANGREATAITQMAYALNHVRNTTDLCRT